MTVPQKTNFLSVFPLNTFPISIWIVELFDSTGFDITLNSVSSSSRRGAYMLNHCWKIKQTPFHLYQTKSCFVQSSCLSKFLFFKPMFSTTVGIMHFIRWFLAYEAIHSIFGLTLTQKLIMYHTLKKFHISV